VPAGRTVFRGDGLQVSRGGRKLFAGNGIDLTIRGPERIALIGSNGAGKSTLLRVIDGAVRPDAGTVARAEGRVAYLSQRLDLLDPDRTVAQSLAAFAPGLTHTRRMHLLAQFLFSGEDVFKKAGQLSGGEKSRLTLARIIYVAPQLLALDEPTNHLDIASREALESALLAYPGTILFVTHDRYLVQKIATHLVYIDSGQAHVFDRLDAFEEWLQGDSEPESRDTPPQTRINESMSPSANLSKNKRDQLQREAAQLEKKIASVESEIAELELCFQNPATGTDWEKTHKRYATLKSTLEQLYRDLAGRWELMG